MSEIDKINLMNPTQTMSALGIVFKDGAYHLKSGEVIQNYEEAKKTAFLKIGDDSHVANDTHEGRVSSIVVVSVSILPPLAKYKLIDMVSFQSTLGTGAFSEFGSSISNLFGTESNMLNRKMSSSVEKCKQALREMAYRLGGNAVIGVNFDFNSNSRDATTVAAQGTVVLIENIAEIFLSQRMK